MEFGWGQSRRKPCRPLALEGSFPAIHKPRGQSDSPGEGKGHNKFKEATNVGDPRSHKYSLPASQTDPSHHSHPPSHLLGF